MKDSLFSIQDVPGIPPHHGRVLTWTGYTTGVGNAMNPYREGEWSYWGGGFQGTLSHGLGINGKRYTVGIDENGKSILLCDGSPTKLLRFDGTWNLISNIGRSVVLRLGNSRYGESVNPVELDNGELAFMAELQLDYANRFPEVEILKDKKRRVLSVLGGWNELEEKYAPTFVIMADGRKVQLIGNNLSQLTIARKAELTKAA